MHYSLPLFRDGRFYVLLMELGLFSVFLLCLTSSLFVFEVSSQIPKRFAFLESAPNVSVIVGHDAYFVCNGGIKWTYEPDRKNSAREIGAHPVSIDSKKDITSLYNLNVIKSGRHLSSNEYISTSVYTMQDDRGRLILRIDNASLSNAGTYRCQGEVNYQDAFLSVHPLEHFAINSSSGLPAIPLVAGMIKFFKMFPSDRANEVSGNFMLILVSYLNNHNIFYLEFKVILYCPLTPVQRVLSWEWREPIPPDSDLAAVLPTDAIPSRTVSFNESGKFSNDNVEIGPDLSWVRILDPFSPEAPSKLWCKFEMQDLWHGKVRF